LLPALADEFHFDPFLIFLILPTLKKIDNNDDQRDHQKEMQKTTHPVGVHLAQKPKSDENSGDNV
jgi:hypothetical protein